MKEKTYNILLVVLSVLLAVSIFLNGWLLHEKTAQTAPENIPGFTGPCDTDADCLYGIHCVKDRQGLGWCAGGLPF